MNLRNYWKRSTEERKERKKRSDGGEAGAGQAPQLRPQRAKGVRMGSDPGGGERLHRSPPNVSTKLFYCKIQSKHIEVGIRGNPPYLNHELVHPVKTDSSFWTLEDGVMHVTLQKRDKGHTWPSPILGQGVLDPYSADLEQKRLMLQRFQEENPGFDFSQAQFSGNCPDPRTFMGGIRSD
uniref:CS domain-containing protein n=1 Tax=Ananas comosus var. bracteatus TaxID=296719 RepID=A0A6V7NPJ5_ANACO|nr:unnamed protein product [Ananas comosus var. bracteatus]